MKIKNQKQNSSENSEYSSKYNNFEFAISKNHPCNDSRLIKISNLVQYLI